MTAALDLAAMSLVESVASVGVVVSSLELLARHRDLRDEGLFSWTIASSRTYLSERWLAVGRVVFSRPGAVALIVLRALSAVVLLAIPGEHPGRTALCVAVALGYGGIFWRTPLGHDGADQMTYLIFLSSALGRAVGGDHGIAIALYFIAAQAMLGYLAAGVAKIVSPVWMKEGLKGVLGTQAYGHPSVHRVVAAQPALGRLLGAAVVGWECLFPLGVAAGGVSLRIVLVAGVVFHAATAVMMGLNNFLWAFAASYPAILYLRDVDALGALLQRLGLSA